MLSKYGMNFIVKDHTVLCTVWRRY